MNKLPLIEVDDLEDDIEEIELLDVDDSEKPLWQLFAEGRLDAAFDLFDNEENL